MPTKSQRTLFSSKQSVGLKKPEGFADTVHDPFDRGQVDGLASAVAAAIERARGVSEAKAQDVETARAKTEAARRKSHRLRVTNIQRWTMARAKLLSVVMEIDKAIQPQGMALGMVDFGAHPFDVAAVQVQLAVLGRPSRATLEIVILQDMSQRLRIIEAQSHVVLPKLPTAPRTERHQYCQVLIAYLEAAVPCRLGREDVICAKCGLFIPAD